MGPGRDGIFWDLQGDLCRKSVFPHSCEGEERVPCPLGSPSSAEMHHTQLEAHTVVRGEQVGSCSGGSCSQSISSGLTAAFLAQLKANPPFLSPPPSRLPFLFLSLLAKHLAQKDPLR